MATLAEVITDRLAGFSVTLTPIRLDTLLADGGMGDGSAFYQLSESLAVRKVVVTALKDVLLMPDLTEGNLSIRWDRQKVADFVASEELELFGKSALKPAPMIQDASNRW